MERNLLGVVMILIGLFLFISALIKSEFVIYKILVAKSGHLWGKNVHRFYQVAGLLIIVFGILMMLKII